MPKSMNDDPRPRRRTARLFKNYDDDLSARRDMAEFLGYLWADAPRGGFCFLATSRRGGDGWRDHVIKARSLVADIGRFLERYSRWDYNLYFCPNFFSQPFRKKEFALPTSLGWCDIDDSDPDAYRPGASVVWQTSPDRYQALWLWDRQHRPQDAEVFSRSLAERHGGDAGWSVTKVLRIPGSINHKPQYDEPFVRLEYCDWRPIAKRPCVIRRVTPLLKPLSGVNAFAHPPEKVIARYRKKLHLKVRYLLDHDRVREPDRSGCIYLIAAGLHEAGADPDEIASVIWRSPYFISKHGQDLGKLNAELSRILGRLEGQS